MSRYWINTISADHVRRGMDGGFTQANHGRPTALRRLSRDDLIAFYSPRTGYPDGEPLQHFTAIARVSDDEPYQVQMTPDFLPWRRRVGALAAEDAPIRPLIDDLTFIRNKRQWGFIFRRGPFEIERRDFERIAQAMGVRLD